MCEMIQGEKCDQAVKAIGEKSPFYNIFGIPSGTCLRTSFKINCENLPLLPFKKYFLRNEKSKCHNRLDL